MLACPCTKDCPNRVGGCFASCDKYKVYAFSRDKEYKQRAIQSNISFGLYEISSRKIPRKLRGIR